LGNNGEFLHGSHGLSREAVRRIQPALAKLVQCDLPLMANIARVMGGKASQGILLKTAEDAKGDKARFKSNLNLNEPNSIQTLFRQAMEQALTLLAPTLGSKKLGQGVRAFYSDKSVKSAVKAVGRLLKQRQCPRRAGAAGIEPRAGNHPMQPDRRRNGRQVHPSCLRINQDPR
jgi:hypothetical protein